LGTHPAGLLDTWEAAISAVVISAEWVAVILVAWAAAISVAAATWVVWAVADTANQL